MEYVYAVLLLHAAGKDVTEENLKKILEAAGIAVDEVRVKSLVAAVKEINIDEVIKTAAVAPVAPAAAGVTPATATQPQPAEEKKEEEEEEEKKEVKEEELAEGLAALFG